MSRTNPTEVPILFEGAVQTSAFLRLTSCYNQDTYKYVLVPTICTISASDDEGASMLELINRDTIYVMETVATILTMLERAGWSVVRP